MDIDTTAPSTTESDTHATGGKTAKKTAPKKAPAASKAPHKPAAGRGQWTKEKTDMAKKKVTGAERAGLTFPIMRIRKRLAKVSGINRVGATAPVCLAAAVEYMVAELLELAGDIPRTGSIELNGVTVKVAQRHRITPRHVWLAARNDEEINRLLRDVMMPSAGVVPNLHKELLKKGKKGTTEDEPPKRKRKGSGKKKSGN